MRPRFLRPTAAAAIMVLLAVVSGCSVISGGARPAAPRSPAASGPDMNPFVASDAQSGVLMPRASQVAPPTSGAYLGVYSPPGPFPVDAVGSFEATAGKRVSIVAWYQPWGGHGMTKFDQAACLAVLRAGAVPMITWEPWDPGNDPNLLAHPADQPAFKLSKIADGTYDEYIKDWAWSIRQLGGPVMLRPMHEMNGTWYPWCGTVNGNKPSEFVAAWRHIHDVFENIGATNVTWVWSINAGSVPDTAVNSYASYYPGDAYVDWTAISGFNWGPETENGAWRTFGWIYSKPLPYLTSLKKPIAIAEVGSVERGGDKAAWIADMFSQVQRIPQIKAVVWFDALEKGPKYTQDWRILSSPASAEAFRTAVAPAYFDGEPPKALVRWAGRLTPEDWTYLSSLEPLY